MNDLKFAFRQLLKNPGFTAVAVGSLALGIGAGTAIFALVHAVLLRALPVPNPQDLRVLRWSGTQPQIGNFMGGQEADGAGHVKADAVSYPVFCSLREQGAAVAEVFGFVELPELGITARARREPFAAPGLMVSDNLFSGLGVRALLGRPLGLEDAASGATPAIVITYEWWEREFGLEAGALGESVTLNGHPFTIVGILPRAFPGVIAGVRTGFYVPMSAQPLLLPSWSLNAPDRWFVRLMARHKAGVSEAQIRSALQVAFARATEATMQQPEILVSDGRTGFSYARNLYRKPLWLLSGVVGVVILVACANLAGLLLARGAGRQHEYAVRAALGARRGRLIRQALVESLLLAGLGGALGMLVARWAKDAIGGLLAGSSEGLRFDTSIDGPVLGFALGTVLVTALLSGGLAALRAGRSDPQAGLKARTALGAPRLRMGRALVVAQVALSVLLLAGAGLYGRTLLNLLRIHPGFATEDLLVFRVSPRTAGYRGLQSVGFYEQAQDRLAAIPGVQSVTLMQNPLLGGSMSGGAFFTLPGRSYGLEPQAYKHTVSETFFATLGIPMLLGRTLSASDTESAARVVVVNQTFARKYFPELNPLGQVLRIKGNDADWHIVGVCQDTKYTGIKDDIPPTVYFSFRQDAIGFGCFAVRSDLPPGAIVPAVRQAIGAVNPLVPVAGLTSLRALRQENIATERLFASLCGALAGLALLLSCVGLYGLMAYQVTRRTGEIGIRLALGATRRAIAMPILAEAFGLATFGVVLALPAVFVLGRLIASQLYGVTPNDPVSLAVAGGVLVAVAVAAAAGPARRAARIDALTAIRTE